MADMLDIQFASRLRGIPSERTFKEWIRAAGEARPVFSPSGGRRLGRGRSSKASRPIDKRANLLARIHGNNGTSQNGSLIPQRPSPST